MTLTLMEADALWHEGMEMMSEAIQMYQPISLQDEFYMEAFGNRNKNDQRVANTKQQQQTNQAAEQLGNEGAKKTDNAFIAFFKRIAEAIRQFIELRRLSAEEKAAYKAFQQAVANDPSVANKRVTVMDFKKVEAERAQLENEIRKGLEAEMNGKQAATDIICQKVDNFVGNLKKGGAQFMTTCSMSSALNIAYQSPEHAQLMYSSMKTIPGFMENLERQVGKKEAKKFDKKMNKLQGKAVLTRAWMRLNGACEMTIKDATTSGLRDVARACTNMVTGKKFDDPEDKKSLLRGLSTVRHTIFGKSDDNYENVIGNAAKEARKVYKVAKRAEKKGRRDKAVDTAKKGVGTAVNKVKKSAAQGLDQLPWQ